METYNQNLDKLSRMGCVEYGIGHIMLFKFGIYVINNFLLKGLAYFASIGVWSYTGGAYFSTFYNAFVLTVKWKIGIKLKVITKSVYKIFANDTGTWGIGVIEYHSFGDLIKDGIFDKADVDKFIGNNGVGHHIVWDGSKGGYLINSDGTAPIKCDLETLQYMARKGMIWETARTIEPDGEEAKDILNFTLFMFKAENKGRLKEFLEVNESYKYLDKALKLFNYGRK